jgi:hypothetical protein
MLAGNRYSLGSTGSLSNAKTPKTSTVQMAEYPIMVAADPAFEAGSAAVSYYAGEVGVLPFVANDFSAVSFSEVTYISTRSGVCSNLLSIGHCRCR